MLDDLPPLPSRSSEGGGLNPTNNKGKKNMKKIKLTLLSIGASAVALAEGTAPTMDTTAAAGIVESAKNGLNTLLTTVTPYISTLVLAGLAIWAGLVIIKLVKRAFSRAA